MKSNLKATPNCTKTGATEESKMARTWGPQGSEFLAAVTLYRTLLGASGGVVNSLDFCPASLKSLGCFYFHFFTMEGSKSEFASFTLPTLITFLEACSQNVSVNKQ